MADDAMAGGAGRISKYMLGILNQATALVTDTFAFQKAAPAVLRFLCQRLNMRFAALSLLRADSDVLSIEIADGLSEEEIENGLYRLGEGVTGRVAATLEPAIIPRVSTCPDFLNRTTNLPAGQEGSFVCVPVTLGRETLGTLALSGEAKPEVELREDAVILGVVASTLAQAIKLRDQATESQKSLVNENRRLRDELRTKSVSSRMIGRSREMQMVLDQVAQVAGSASTVLINGETGSGKELVAQALHFNGPRAEKPFIKVNCAALPETLIESELFGHEKGAFTGAVAARPGRFEQANGGTIFLDEIGDISPLMQVKLLRVLQEREFERVGGNRTISVDVRVVAATHRDLMAMVRQGTFRGDLYYRINVFPIRLPPLRQRQPDLPLLAEHFMRKYAEQANKTIDTITPEAMRVLMEHSWPGNVRELENCMEHAVILAAASAIGPEHLPSSLYVSSPEKAQHGVDYKTLVDNFERELLTEALRASRGNVTQAAARLGATTRVVSYRIRQLGINASKLH